MKDVENSSGVKEDFIALGGQTLLCVVKIKLICNYKVIFFAGIFNEKNILNAPLCNHGMSSESMQHHFHFLLFQ